MASLQRWVRGRWRLLLLIGSLALNVFLIALEVGDWLRHGVLDGRSHDRLGAEDWARLNALPASWPRLIQRLPDDIRQPVEAAFQAHDAEIEPALQELRRAQRAAFEALVAEPFVPAALADLLAQVEAATALTQAALYAAIREAAAQLDPAQRAQLAEKLAGRRSGP